MNRRGVVERANIKILDGGYEEEGGGFMEFMQVAFFAPLNQYEAAGMFTIPHLVALLSCSLILIGGLWFSFHYLVEEHVIKVTRGIAWLVAVLELIKMIYKFYYGYTAIDSWLPLSFCSLFIYATFMSGYGQGRVKKIGDAFILMGGAVGGISFLLMPTTSLMSYPIWHFLSVHSLLFHVLMIYLNGLYLRYYADQLTLKTYKYFSFYFLGAALLSLTLNGYYGANLMIIQKPLRIPIECVQSLYHAQPYLYTCLAIASYLMAPALFAAMAKFFFTHRQLSEETTNQPQEYSHL